MIELGRWCRVRVQHWPFTDVQVAEPIADHRLDYLTYEGPLTGNRGTVKRRGSGEYQTLEHTASQWRVRTSGTLVGILSLVSATNDGLAVQLVWQPVPS